MKSFALFALITSVLIAAPAASAQKRLSRPVPILVGVISGDVATSPTLARPKAVREFGTTANAGNNYDLERRVFDILNDERSGNGLAPLRWSNDVADLARSHSQNMADYKFFSHRDTGGLTVDGRAESYGLAGWRGIGENIATLRGRSDPAVTAVETWMNSPGHRQNILGGRWSDSAVGVAVAKDGTYYFTQVFILR